VSYVVPVYNKARHLPRVLAQIARQQGDFRRQYVFVDDGSTDGSLDILRAHTRGWENLVIESQANAGSAAATNRGIALARESFVKFVDADDLIGDHATAMLLKSLRDSDACLTYGEAVRYAEEETLDLRFHAEAPPVTRLEAPLRAAIRNSMFNPTQFLARTEAVKAVGGCDERVVYSQEYGLTLRLARRWPFLRLGAPVAWLPQESPGRLSTNEGRQLQRVTHLLALFLADSPDLPAGVRRYACVRAAGRAYKFARRRGGEGALGAWFWRHLAARLGLVRDAPAFVEACCQAFRAAEGAPPGEAA
jgi:glycosyltransferase involved in cell wall biosynthesis